jgi:hypothetical protein
MKFNAAQQVQAGMIELDLQQAWECLSAGQFDLTIHHFEQAIKKTREMKAACHPKLSTVDNLPPTQKQIDIDL